LEATRDELLFEVHKMAQEEGPKPDKTVGLLFVVSIINTGQAYDYGTLI